MLAINLKDSDFSRLSAFIEKELGIKMPPSKRALLESRLQKRLKILGLGSFSEYCDYVFSPRGFGGELVQMIDLVTTNKTDFFREPAHFDILSRRVLPELSRRGAGSRRPLNIWSAGCSSGEEPYTIAMVASEYGKAALSFDFSIYATDISTRMLDAGRAGIYAEERIIPVPDEMKRRYVLRSRDKSRGLVRMAPELREKIRFGRLNFMDDDLGLGVPMDIIFCRNVVIYFDKDTQEELFGKFCGELEPGGYLFIGHSESINGFDLPLEKVATSVFRRL